MSTPTPSEIGPERAHAGLTGALLAVATLTVSGCASGTPPWQIAPVYQVSHATSATSEAAAYLAMAHRFDAEGRGDAALRAFRMAATAAPGSAAVQHDLGVALAQQGHIDEGVAALRRAAELTPTDARVLNNLGYALAMQGRTQEATDCLLKALSLQPDYPTARHNLARLQASPPPAIARETPETRPTPPTPTPTPTPTATAMAMATPGVGGVVAPPTPSFLTTPALPRAEPLAQTPTPPQSPHADAPPPTRDATIEIRNGHGVPRAASRLKQWLAKRGVAIDRLGNARPFDAPKSRIEYTPGHEAAAYALADRLGGGIEMVQVQATPTLRADVRLTLGHDLRNYSEARLRPLQTAPVMARAAVDTHR